MGKDNIHKKAMLRIKGMSCVNCQNKIESGLIHKDGVIGADVSYSKETAFVCYDESRVSLWEIIEAVEGMGYQAESPGAFNSEKQSPDLAKTVCLILIMVSLYILLQSFGILNLLAPGRLADSAMGYGMLFVIGLVTSVHCIAMCGGIHLSQCITKPAAAGKTRISAYGPSLLYNLGRVWSYTVTGFVLGLAGFAAGGGSRAAMSFLLQGILKIIAGVYMIIMGMNMSGIFPWLRRFTLRMPGFMARRITKEKSAMCVPLVVGILNGFMPCGPLQSMWVVALASGNPAAGALSMFLFSLGTVPLMLGFGTVVSALGKKFAEKAMTAGAVLIVVLGFAMLSQGGALSGWFSPRLLLLLMIAFFAVGIILSIPVQQKILKYIFCAASLAAAVGCYCLGNVWQTGSEPASHVEIVDGVQIVSSILEPGGYPGIAVEEGMPVRWIIEAPEGSINGCNYRMIIQDYGIEYEFQQGENVIEFVPEQAGTVQYSCWMGMIHGRIDVTESTDTTAEK